MLDAIYELNIFNLTFVKGILVRPSLSTECQSSGNQVMVNFEGQQYQFKSNFSKHTQMNRIYGEG